MSTTQLFFLVIFTLFAFEGSLAAEKPLDLGIDAVKSGNFKQAESHLVPLAKSGNPIAQFWLSKAYSIRLNDGKSADIRKSVFWMFTAAKNGDARAQFEMGNYFEFKNGSFREKDKFNRIAFDWYKLAAEQGHALAQRTLGNFLTSKPGIEEDGMQAYMWHKLAYNRFKTEKGPDEEPLINNYTRLSLNSLEKVKKKFNLTDKDIENVQQLVNQWEASHSNAIKTWPLTDD